MSNADLFRSARSLVENARRHTDDLDQLIKLWLQTKPYVLTVELDPKAGMNVHKLKLVGGFDERFSTRCFDIASNLRAALDHAVYASALAFGNAAPKKAKFPFGSTLAEAEANLRHWGKDVPSDITPLLMSFQPHKSGNPLLWSLNKMRNTQIHNILVPASITTDSVEIVPAVEHGQNWSFLGLMRVQVGALWDADKNEIEVLRATAGIALHCYLDISTFVAIGEIDGLRGQPAIAAFHNLAGIVDGIISAIEAECRRLGKLA